jgi:hypothetical protein
MGKNIEIRLYAGKKDVLDVAGWMTKEEKIMFEQKNKFHWGYIPEVFFQMEDLSEINKKAEAYLRTKYPNEKYKIKIEISDR